MKTKHSLGPWELDSAKDGDTRYFVIHGQLPPGINGDFGYPVCDSSNRHHAISPEEDAANARLIAAAPEMLKQLIALVGQIRASANLNVPPGVLNVIEQATGERL